MKTMTCLELGGACDQQLSAETWKEMVEKMTNHVMENHPGVAEKMKRMHEKDPEKWGREMKIKWEATPSTGI